MSNEKKLCAKRLAVYLLFAFGLAWIPWIILNKTVGYEEWFTTNHYALFVIPTLYAPAFANLLTRLITKEGFSDMKLHLRLKGHWKYYLAAWLLSPLLSILSIVLFNCVYGYWNWAEIRERMTFAEGLAAVLTVLGAGPLGSFNTIGEEFGWRAYMNQKMEPLLGTAGTVLAGGILWGVWHAPLTVEGHNFGKDYPGYPYVGILLMSLSCILSGAILMRLTKRTDSVYPAAVFHAMNNNGGAVLGVLLLVNSIGDPEAFMPDAVQFIVLLIPTAIAAGITLALMLRERKKVPPADS